MLRDQFEGLRARLADTGWAPWLILGLAVFLRFFLLGIKPPHFDEGINGWFVDVLTKNGFYRYDPTNYHGPLHFYMLFLSETLFGRSVWALRLPVVLVSIVCVWLTLKFEPFVGRTTSRIAALAMAISPGFVFYGRYSIHEVWMVLFSMLFILGLLGLWKSGTANYLWCAGMGVAGMILTKETYVIHLGCAALAGLVCYASNLLMPTEDSQGGFSRSALGKGPRPVLQEWQLPVGIHLVASAFLMTAAFLPSLASRWRDYVWFFAAIGLFSAFFIPMKLAYGKSGEQIVRGISARCTIAFFFSLCIQAGFFLPWPWNAWFLIVGPIGVMSAFFVPMRRLFVVNYDRIDLAMVVSVATLVILFFYSGTFFHWSGVKGLYQAYSAWFATGHEGHGHEKPWYYWVATLMVRYEWPALVGLAIPLAQLWTRNAVVRWLTLTTILGTLVIQLSLWIFVGLHLVPFGTDSEYFWLPIGAGLAILLCLGSGCFRSVSLRYLGIYGVGAIAAYSIVHYKTPWCIISILWPVLFIFGAGFSLIPAKYRPQATAAVAALLFASLLWSVRLNYCRCTTDTEPYVYVQTYNDIFKFTDPLLKLARRNPANYHLTGSIIRGSSYPLPWILGDFSHTGYYEHDAIPAKVDADFLLVQEDRISEIEGKLQDTYFTETLRIRSYQDSSKAYFRASVFKDLFPNRTPEFKGKKSG